MGRRHEVKAGEPGDLSSSWTIAGASARASRPVAVTHARYASGDTGAADTEPGHPGN
jgi:hypothetical protein